MTLCHLMKPYYKWILAMNEELKSMKNNEVLKLGELLEGFKPIDFKWVFKNQERF